MSLFRRAGEKFEETKRVLVGTEAAYACRSCEEPVAEDYEHCPHCGAATVEPVE